jgi:hypothetical protein
MTTQIDTNVKRDSFQSLALNLSGLLVAYLIIELYLGTNILGLLTSSLLIILVSGGLWWEGNQLIAKSYFVSGTKQKWFKGLKSGLKYIAWYLAVVLVFYFVLYKFDIERPSIRIADSLFVAIMYGSVVKAFNLAKVDKA